MGFGYINKRMVYNEDRFTVHNIRDYRNITNHAVNAEVEYIYIWSNLNDAWDYEQIDVTVEDDEVLIQEVNETVRQGRYAAVKLEKIKELVDKNIIESTT